MKKTPISLIALLFFCFSLGSCVIAHLLPNENVEVYDVAPYSSDPNSHSVQVNEVSVKQGVSKKFNVNVFTGTGGHGHTFPGATAPFGMVQLSPDTRLDGWDGCGGYHYSDSIIYGFTHTHLQGTGVSDYGDILFMPTNGHTKEKTLWRDAIASRFAHNMEVGSPGFYGVRLSDYGIDARMTASTHAGMHEYKMQPGDSCLLFLDFMHRDKLLYYDLHFYGDTAISGYRVSEAWATEQHTYFYAVFSQPFVANDQLMQRSKSVNEKGETKIEYEMIQAFQFLFLPTEKNELIIRVGISGVDEEGAKRNLYAEMPVADFRYNKQKVEEEWQKVFEKAPAPTLFPTGQGLENYRTSLYHCYTVPNVWSDVDGRYRGMDNKIHTAEGYTRYTVFSLWDTFRAYHPMMCKLEPERTKDWMKTFLEMYKERGELPVWELAGNETYCMIGYHSVPVVAEAYQQGIRFSNKEDELKMLEAMIATSNGPQDEKKAYVKYGYVPGDEFSESVSKTLEFAYDDFCISRYAEMIGEKAVAAEYAIRSQNWKNVFDPETKFMRARVNGGFATPFDPYQVNFHYTEANAWQYRFFVPHAIPELMELMGGPKEFEAELDKLFNAPTQTTGREQADITGLIGQYAHGNEPSHHMAYLYSYVNRDKVHMYRDSIMKTLYSPTPDGLCGNEDCGQMSAWYVVSAWNTYPICPADYTGWWQDYDPTPEFIVQNQGYPSPFPTGLSLEKKIVPAPIITAPNRAFVQNQLVTITCTEPNVEIVVEYRDERNKVNSFVYTAPFMIDDACEIRAQAKKRKSETQSQSAPQYIQSSWTTATYYKRPDNLIMKEAPSYDAQYTAGGDYALIDGIRGKLDFRTGVWQGVNGPLETIIELKKAKTIHSIQLNTYQDIRPWIWFPSKVQFSISKDGTSWDEVYNTTFTELQKKEGAMTHNFIFDAPEPYKVDLTQVKYVKIIATPAFDQIPNWHLGAGGKPWIFADEIIIF
jgi:predicted alpha-1,2-mannosidase